MAVGDGVFDGDGGDFDKRFGALGDFGFVTLAGSDAVFDITPLSFELDDDEDEDDADPGRGDLGLEDEDCCFCSVSFVPDDEDLFNNLFSLNKESCGGDAGLCLFSFKICDGRTPKMIYSDYIITHN